jgi:PhnB protein
MHMKFIPYLSFNARCREAFEFYAKVLDGEIVAMISHGETPAAGHFGAENDHLIINAHLVADGAELMGGDTPPGMGPTSPSGFCVSIQIDDDDRGERIFSALAEGGSVLMPFEPSFWARRFGMVTDRYGTPWMINCGMPNG